MEAARLLPLTVASLSQRELGNSDIVVLVGTVERQVSGFVFVDFVLNDGTGRVPIRHCSSANLPNLIGRYIRVSGRCVETDNKYISAASVIVVENPDEISFHRIQAAHVYVCHQAAR